MAVVITCKDWQYNSDSCSHRRAADVVCSLASHSLVIVSQSSALWQLASWLLSWSTAQVSITVIYVEAPKDFVMDFKNWRNDEYPSSWQKYWFLTKFNKIAVLNCKTVTLYYFTLNQYELSPKLQRIFNSYHHLHQSINNILNVNSTGIVRSSVLMTSLVTSCIYRTLYARYDYYFF